MIRRTALMLGVLMILCLFAGCRGTKTVHCDHCGDEIVLSATDKIEEDWIVFCKTCEEELFGENPVVSPAE